MACKIAENEPLAQLRMHLGLKAQCHSLRLHCLHGYERPVGDFAMGVPGAAIGYCQALFGRHGDPYSHTRHVIGLLEEIDAPWAWSHELFWGYRHDEQPARFFAEGIAPLLGTGRVPILITPLDPAEDIEMVEEIFTADPSVFPGETTLVRIVLRTDQSCEAAARLIQGLIARSRQHRRMPPLWPLLQGSLNERQWRLLHDLLAEDWRYVNLAVNPFTIHEMPEFCMEQVTVGQVVVGHADGILPDGTIRLPAGMRISGAVEESSYLMPEYFESLARLDVPPTLIILGPSLPHWTDRENQERVALILPHMRAALDTLWSGLSSRRRTEVWRLVA